MVKNSEPRGAAKHSRGSGLSAAAVADKSEIRLNPHPRQTPRLVPIWSDDRKHFQGWEVRL